MEGSFLSSFFWSTSLDTVKRVGDCGQRARARTVVRPSAGKKDMSVSHRIETTQDPVVTRMRALVASTEGTLSLAQGIVFWEPPPQALSRVQTIVKNMDTEHSIIHGYGPDEGMSELREELVRKLANENSLSRDYIAHVTHGAQQAFANIVLALADEGDSAVLFAPYYFNHHMMISMTLGTEAMQIGPCTRDTFHPDLAWLEEHLSQHPRTKMVVLVNPNNPTGVVMTKDELDRAAALCKAHNVWLVIDNTYEHFTYEGHEHYCPSDPHVIHIFSFSKAFGMMGWRQGYIAFHKDAPGNLAAQLLKVQDTVPICATQLSQYMSLGALEAGRSWVNERVKMLEDTNRAYVLDAVSCLGEDALVPSEGAIYVFCKLPEGYEDDEKVVEWLVKKHKICVIPGSSCGCKGYIRIAFGNLPADACRDAAARLKSGLLELVEKTAKIH